MSKRITKTKPKIKCPFCERPSSEYKHRLKGKLTVTEIFCPLCDATVTQIKKAKKGYAQYEEIHLR